MDLEVPTAGTKDDDNVYDDDDGGDSSCSCSTAYYSAPASPLHFALPAEEPCDEFEFSFSTRYASLSDARSMISADELFLDGRLLPMKRLGSIRRRRKKEMEGGDKNDPRRETIIAPLPSSSGTGRRWVFLKDLLLHRSKKEGRGTKVVSSSSHSVFSTSKKQKDEKTSKKAPCERHYTVKRAQMEEMRRRTYLPYRQGLLGGCIGLGGPRGYGAMNGLARTIDPVGSR